MPPRPCAERRPDPSTRRPLPGPALASAFLLAATAFVPVAGIGGIASANEFDPVAAEEEAAPAPGRQANYALEIDAPEEIAGKIRELTFVGRWQYREDFLPSQMPALLARLDEEVMGILRSLGYYGGRVESAGDANRVEVRVRAGPRVTVALSNVRVEGPAAEDRRVARFVRSRWLLPEGSFFASREWERGKRGLVDALNQRGYLRARIVHSDARIDAARSAAELEVVLDSGPRIAFGELEIGGLERHGEKIVRDLRPFRPGDPYSLEELLAYEAALRDSGYFSGVSVVPALGALEEDPELREVPLSVDLVEHKARRAVFGIGYSSEQGARGQVGFEHRDLFGRSWQLESSLIAAVRRQRLFANVRTPQEATGHFYGFGGRFENLEAAGEHVERGNVYVGRGKRTADIEWFLSLQMQAEERRLAGNERFAAIEDDAHALVLGYSWNLRRLNSRVLPRRGYTISTQISGAARGVASNRSFVRFYGRAMRFIPMPRRSFLAGGTLIALGELGWVAAGSRREIPSENLFRAGGSHSVRGYGYQTLGVKEAGATVGGRYLGVGSLEYQHPVSESMAAAVFYDIGNATDSTHDFEPVAGYGVGVRWRTPVGPLNLDVAYGDAVDRWRVHFSVGYTF